MKKLVAAMLVLAAVFLAGFIPERLNVRRVRSENARLQLELSLARLEGKLGMMGEEVRRSNFANATAISTDFFNGIRRQLSDPLLASDPSRRARLEEIAARRDEVTADLARADAAVQGKLAEMYMQFAEAVAGS